MLPNLSKKIKSLPRDPGVYLFSNNIGRIIYIGKAKNLKSRVSSYFQKNLKLEPKTRALVSRIVDLSIIKTSTELDALILEAELIRKHKPKYNVIHKDDKSNIFIVIRKDKIKVKNKVVRLPKVITARKTDLLKSDIKFGPFTNSSTTKQLLRTMRKIFPFRDCAVTKFAKYHKIDKPCLFGHLKLCPAPCLLDADLISVNKNITNLKRTLSGKSPVILRNYNKQMLKASKEEDFETAAYFRDMVKRFEYIRSSFKTADQYIENPNLVEDMALKALYELKECIPLLQGLPIRIECYDISNISGKEAVGSMVVSLDGLIQKNQYKRFKIRLKDKPDDSFMLSEVLSRRLKRGISAKETNSSWDLPDLFVLDGGKSQVSAGLKTLNLAGVDIPLIGLAKRKETIVLKEGGEFKEVNLPETNEGLKLLMRLRDEAHRFAQNYHHHLRLKKIKV